MSVPADRPAAAPAPTPGRRAVRFLPLALIGLVSLTVIALGWHNHLSFAGLLASRAAIDAMVAGHPIAALAGFTGIYAVAVALSLPGAVFLTICGGAVFGALAGGLAALVGDGEIVVRLPAGRDPQDGQVGQRVGWIRNDQDNGIRRHRENMRQYVAVDLEVLIEEAKPACGICPVGRAAGFLVHAGGDHDERRAR